MATPIPFDLRVKIVRDRQSGKSFKTIAQDTGCSKSGVRKIWQRYQAAGMEGLATDYTNGGRRSPYDEFMHELIERVKTGDQGAPYIRFVLMERYPNQQIPHERTIQRWLKAKGLNRPRGNPRSSRSRRATELHHTWQIDGKEQVRLKTGQQVSWLNIGDEASGSNLLAGVSPQCHDESMA